MFKSSLLIIFTFVSIGCFIVRLNEARNIKTPRRPIILVPGFGGSQLYANLNGVENAPNIFCVSNWRNYFLMWLRIDLLLPYVVDCFIHYMQLVYDPASQNSIDRKGVDIKTLNWGDTSEIEYIAGPIKLGPTVYYGKLVDHLVKNYGYERNVSIRGVPYDFRKTPRENTKVISDMKQLVEQTYELNNKTKVILLGHSYGCIYILHVLNKQSAAWKEKYIDSFISTSGPLGGAARAVMAVSTGDNLNIPVLNPRTFGKLSRTWPSTYLFLPRQEVWESEVVAMTNKRNYTVKDFKNFFFDSNNPVGDQIYKNELRATDLNQVPGVKVYCMYSVDRLTPEVIDWRSKRFPDEKPNVKMGPGDGTVNARSLNVCSGWGERQKEEVHVKLFENMNHIGIVRSDEWVEHVTSIVTS